jgi:glycine/D-amino acid oxidase-like deaminating enzyme
MLHDAHGHWIASAPASEPQAPLQGDQRAEVAIVGGGYTGLWTAWWLKQHAPELDVALLESGLCGHGPSGRNGGFCNSMWFSLPTLIERFGDERALEICRSADDSVSFIGRWCEEEGVDAHYRRGGYLEVSTCTAQDGAWSRALGEAERLGAGEAAGFELSAEQVRARCDSPRFRAGALFGAAASVDPARLALGLRERVIEAGVRIYEHSAITGVDRPGPADVAIALAGGTLRAERAVLATGASLLRVRGLRRALTATSSHMVVTEPVPDLLDEIGWRGGECVSDSRAMIHYFRTTHDDRIAFGWGGGRIIRGARINGRAEVDPRMARAVGEHLRSFFPGLEGKRIERAWGGPIYVSPAHLPLIRSLDERIFAGFGYTGNGVGPSQLIGRTLASLALDRRDELTRLALVDPTVKGVPPEPFRYIGGSAIRRAILRKERLEEEGRSPDPITRAVCGIPERVGIHVGR